MPQETSLYLGIDPGQSGGLAAIDGDGVVHLLTKMPETDQDILCEMPTGDTVKMCVIEKVHSFPGQGISSAFKFGMGFGGLKMALTAIGIRFEEVSPQVWQKALGVVSRDKKLESKRDHKTKLLVKAQNLFPSVKITLATADAILIAEFCRRKCLGLL